MTELIRMNLDEAAPSNSRVLARRIAAEMVLANELPNAEIIRKRIVVETNGSLNPSALTIQSEVKAWYAEEFWPTFHAMGTVPKDSEIPAEVRTLFQASFQSMVVQLFASARASFDGERQEYQRQVGEADRVVRDLHQTLRDNELRAAGAEDRYQAEARAHAETQLQLAASGALTRDLNAKLQAALEQQAKHEHQLNETRTAERHRADAQIEVARADAQRHIQEIDNLRQRVKAQDLALVSQASETRRLALENAKASAEATASRAELAHLRAVHTEEVGRMAGALRAAQVVQAKPVARVAGGQPIGGGTSGRKRTSLRKPTRA